MTNIPIKKNPRVKDLLAIMETHQLSNMGDMLDILDQVSAVEAQLKQAVGELSALRKELQESKRPLTQKALIAAQAQVLDLRNRVHKLKQAVTDGCKRAISAFGQKGLSALENVSRFFKVRPLLEGIRGQTEKCLASLEKLEACAKMENKVQKPSLRETLKQNAEKSKAMFDKAQPGTKPQEPSL